MRRFLAVAALAVVAPGWALAAPAIRINEFLPNPTDSDGGYEWIELYNADSVQVDVAGYKLQKQTSNGGSFTAGYNIPTGNPITVLDPGEYLVVADSTAVVGADLYKGTSMSLPNGSGGDALRLVDAGNGLVDIVIYGGVNTDEIQDPETSATATSIAPNPPEGSTLARSPNGVDTNHSGDDFIVPGTITFRAANPNPPVCDLASGIVINEILPDPVNNDTGNEYVELYNGAGRTVSLEAWSIAAGTSSFSPKVMFAAGVEIAAGDFLLVGENMVAGRDVTGTLAMGNAGTSADAVQLVDCAGDPADTVVYGTPNSDGWVDDTGVAATSLAPFAAEQAVARRLDGVDTNLSADDFQATATLTPGAANPVPVACEANDGRVVINEILPDPVNADTGYEWIELYNNGATPAQVEGWTIRTASSATFTVKATLPSLVVPAQGRVLIGESLVAGTDATADLTMGNGTGGDAVRLVDCEGTVADTVTYGDPANPDGVLDDTGNPSTSLAPTPGAGHSLARWTDGTDTGQSLDDFLEFVIPTPDAPNVVTGGGAGGHVVINEFLPDPITPDPPATGGDAGFEWIELYNLESATVDVAGYRLQRQGTSAASWTTMYTFPVGDPNTIIQPGGYLVVADDPDWVPDADYYKGGAGERRTLGIPQGTGGDGLRLVNASTVLVDLVVYGGVNTDAIEDEDGGAATSIAPKPIEGSTLARSPNANDTDLSGADFRVEAGTMGTANPSPPACDLADGLVINELLPDPAGGADDEYVEIYNGAGRTVNLLGWKVEAGTSSFSPKTTFGAIQLAANDFLLVGASGVAGADVTATLDLGNATDADAVLLRDCATNVMDTVVYGTPNGDLWIDDTGSAATSLAPFATTQAIARRLDGVDTDLSADDFQTTTTLTPGALNPVPPSCETDDGRVVINEILPDPFGADDGKEWIELYNNGDAAVELGGWTVRFATSGDAFSVMATLPTLPIPAHSRILLGESDVAGTTATVGLGLGAGSGGDALRLVDCAGNTADTLAYGDTGNADGVVDDSGVPATSLAAGPQEGRSLGRRTDGVDTDDSGADFEVFGLPTPNAENVQSLAGGRVVINEFMANPITPDPPGSGGDAGFEWIEIYNLDDVQVDVGGYKLQKQTSGTTWTTMFTFPTGNETTKLDPGEYVVVADDPTWVPGAQFYKGAAGARDTLSIPQGTGGDALRIFDTASVALDLVVYGGVNTDNLVDDSGNPATSIAPSAAEGYSLARSPNGTDTGLSGDDFIATQTVTMGTANPDPPNCDVATGLVINEFLPDPPNTDTGNEYVEIYNGAGRTVQLEGWQVVYGSSSFPGSGAGLPSGLSVAAGDFFVIGDVNVAGRDATVTLAMGNAASSADGVRLLACDGSTSDTVIYGTPNSDHWVDDTGLESTSLAPFTASQAVARRLDGVDTNLSGDDFQATPTLTPGTTNPPPTTCETDDGRVVINEFLPNPAGADSGNEWVELYNNGAGPVRIDGWTIRVASSGDQFSVKTTMPAALEIQSHGYVLIGEANVTNTQHTGTLAMGSGSGGDSVRLVDCAGNVADTVAYGEGGNADGVVDDSNAAATSLGPDPGDGEALARKRDGVDTDQSGEDFAVALTATPGATNPELICVQNTGNVKLNEIVPDPDGSDSEAAAEFIELYNAGSEAVDLDGWQLITSGAGDDRAVDIVLPPDTRIPAETWLVIGNANVVDADVYAEFSMGNGTGGDGVYLLDCTGAMVDFVGYGDDNEDLLTDEQGTVVTEMSTNPGSAQSLARVDDGVDNNAADDWFVDTTPTPGATNFQEPIDVPDDDTGCGCNRGNAPGSGAPEGGCSTVPLPLGGGELLVLLVAIRRRRP